MSASTNFEQIVVHNKYIDTNVSASCCLHTVVDMKVSKRLKSISVSNVYQNLLAEKNHIGFLTWSRIELSCVGGSQNFFFNLFDIMIGYNSVYFNNRISAEIKQNNEAQAVARAFYIIQIQ